MAFREVSNRCTDRSLKCGREVRGRWSVCVTDEYLVAVMNELRGAQLEPQRGESLAACERHRDFIKSKLDEGLLLMKVSRLMKRQGIAVPYATLHRFAVKELGLGLRANHPGSDCARAAGHEFD